MSILVLGATGQVAAHLRELLPEAEYWGKQAYDLTKPAGLTSAIVSLAPRFIVNAAAYTAVDKAEEQRDAAWSVNAESPAMAARAAALLDIPIVQISSDHVFDGLKTGEYTVDDGCKPLGVYGSSKLAGELAVRSLAPRSWILRSGWVFSEHGSNFAKTILRFASEQEELRVVDDQLGRPTYAGDLARLIAVMTRFGAGDGSLPYGTYHAVGGPAVSRHAFAEAIVAAGVRRHRLARAPHIARIATSEYPTAARRPANSVLSPSEELRALNVEFDWMGGLDRAVARAGP